MKLLIASPPTSFLILVSREYDIRVRFDVQKSSERSTKKLGGGKKVVKVIQERGIKLWAKICDVEITRGADVGFAI